MNNHLNHYRNVSAGNSQWVDTARKLTHHSQMAISLAHRLRAFSSPVDEATIDQILDVFKTVEKLTRTLPSMQEPKPLTPSQY